MRLPIKIAVGEALEVLDMFADESVSIKSVVKDMNDRLLKRIHSTR